MRERVGSTENKRIIIGLTLVISLLTVSETEALLILSYTLILF